ncbi:MAG: hypothetical protein ACI9TV_001245 [Sulfurimonas sp.]|jgi:hypothetical protein|uniref:DUF4214 domain-containing protein n=1 Tax=Sulfurimonas sp. TaxID=2022749 RepID=UPI0039E2A892
MALTQTQISELYVAIFNRASEGEGNTYWQNIGMTSELTADAMLATSDAQSYFGSSLDSNQAFIEHIYANTLNKTIEDDAEGIAYWTDLLDNGATRGEVVTGLVEAIYSYADSTDPVTEAAYTQFVNRVAVSDFTADIMQAAPSDYAVSTSFNGDIPVSDDPQTVSDAMISISNINEDILHPINDLFTLKKNITETVSTQVVVTEGDATMMWGDPDCADCNITADSFFGAGGYLASLVGSDLALMAADSINIGGDTALTSIVMNVVDTDGVNAGTDDVTITTTTADGEQFTSELALGQAYIDFLDGVLYYTDPDTGAKTSRLTSVKADDTSATTTTYTYSIESVVLTTEVNNGGTWETGYTSNKNLLIIAGQTELLHGAYIDAGEGMNVLEVDMKGVYAQPLAILNVQEVRIENLPNVYDDFYTLGGKSVEVAADGTVTVTDTTTDANTDGLDIPDYNAASAVNQDSILDLSRAIDVQKVVITEGNDTATSSLGISEQALGELVVVGIRNGAELVLEGEFTENVTVNYGQGMGSALELTLNLGDVDGVTFDIFSNSNTININSIGGGNVLDNVNFGTSTVLNMNIAGTAKLVVSEDIADVFTAGHPATIDASANLAGVDLTIGGPSVGFDDEVVFMGTAFAGDHFTAYSERSVEITDGNGNNEFLVKAYEDITITSGDGANQINATSIGSVQTLDNEDVVTVTVGNGNNDITASSTDAFIITAGSGDNRIEATSTTATGTTDADASTIVVGDGQNEIDASALVLSIVTGDGNNEIDADGSTNVVITTGEGNDTINATDTTSTTIDAGNGSNSVTVVASTIAVTTGTGTDSVTIGGNGKDYSAVDSDFAMLTIDLGTTGANTLVIGTDNTADLPGVTAMTGSTITGENITLDVNKDANLSQAAITGVTTVSLDGGSNLTITKEQFLAIGSTNFSVDGVAFGEKAELTIVVSESMNFDELGITLSTFACDDINLNIVLACDNPAENVFTLTAEQLDIYLANDGIMVDANNGYDNNQVIVTNAGLDFDATTAVAGGDIDITNGTDDVTVIRNIGGYERPTEDDIDDSLNINTDTDTVPATITGSAVTVVTIEGAQDITTSLDLADNASVDFSALTGTANLTYNNFADLTEDGTVANWGTIVGNGNARLEVTFEDTAASANANVVGLLGEGIKISGVETLVTTGFETSGDAATVYLCEDSADINVVGLQGSWNETVIYKEAAWDVDVLLEAATNVKTNQLDIGAIEVDYKADDVAARGALATGVEVSINNQGTATTNTIWVESIDLTNAADVTVAATDGSVNILNLDALEASSLTFTSANDVTTDFATGSFATGFDTLDASGVVGTFTANVSATSDLSGVTVTGMDALALGSAVDLTLSADQVTEFGATVSDADADSTLNVNGLDGTHTFDLSAIDVSNIGVVTTADVDGTIVLATPSLGGADALVINAMTSDTTLEMTVDQFHTYCGSTNEVGMANIGCNATGTNEATLDLVGATASSSIDLTNVDQTEATVDDVLTLDVDESVILDAVSVTIQIADVVATADMEIINGTVTLEVSGTNDLTLLNTKTALDATIVDVNFTADATLTLTADQVMAIEAAYMVANPTATDSAFSIAAGANVTVNVIDLDSTQALNLDLLQAAGITIGTVSITDNDAANTLNAATTFGGAASIITPTADQSTGDAIDGIEPTSVTMTIQQLATTLDSTITGDSQVNLTGLVNNVDTNADYVADEANYDLSNINNAGTVEFTDQLTGETVTLASTANLGGFDIDLYAGDMIQFATETQASGTTVTEKPGTNAVADDAGDTVSTAIAWLFDTITAQIDTTNYDADITTLYVNEDLIDIASGNGVEDLWNTLPSSIVVEVVNSSDIPDVLVSFNRTVTVEAMTGLTGMTFDDQNEFQTISNLTINLEGNTNVGNIIIDDTVGAGNFDTLTINSYEDRHTINDNGFVFMPNIVGDISMSATPSNELVNVTLNTNDFADPVDVSDIAVLRDGLALEVGTITVGTQANTDRALVTLTGDNDITVAAIDMSDTDITLVTVDNNTTAGDVTIGGTEYTATNVFMIDGHTVSALNAGTDFAATGTNVLVVTNGANDLTAATAADIDSVSFTGDATLTLTAAQVLAITITDTTPNDGIADNWAANGHTVTLNITDLGTQALDLDAIQAAGINIGTVSVTASAELNAATTLGNADLVSIEVDGANIALEMTAAQYKTIDAGNIVETLSAAAVTAGFTSSVQVDELEAIEDVTETVTIDLSTVSTTGLNTVELGDGMTPTSGALTTADSDVKLDNATDLGDFAVTLYDLDTALSGTDISGQTIRFANEIQAGRLIEVVNSTIAGGDTGTNVVWMFDTTTGAIETTYITGVQGYDSQIGRLWIMEDLVDGGNVEAFYTTLSGDIIVRIDNTNLTDQLVLTLAIDRDVEVSSFTSVASLEFTDDDLLEHIFDLSITMGGEANIGDLVLDNLLAPVNPSFPSFPGDDEFGTLTINSFVADTTSHYLLPDDFDAATDVLPNAALYGFDGTNIIGDISSGATRGELASVVINTGSGTTDAPLEVQTIYFADDSLTDTNLGVATFSVTGDSSVTVKSLDTSDAEIIALTVTNTLSVGASLTVTGGSPAFDGGDATGDTETLTINSGLATVETTFGSTDGVTTYAGVSGEDLSIVTINGLGTVDLGTVARVDSEAFALAANAAAVVSMTLGTADANGLIAPTLSATGTWTFTGVDTMTIDSSTTFNAGGTLSILGTVITTTGTGAIDWSGLTLDLTGSTIELLAGDTLTLTAAQADALTVTGAGTVEILNLEADTDAGTPGIQTADLSNIMTATGDTGVVNAYADTSDIDADTIPEAIVLDGALGVAHVTITGDGSASVTASMAATDRNDPATGTDASDDTYISFTVDAAATLNLLDTQAGAVTGDPLTAWMTMVDGAGTVHVDIQGATSNADLSGLTATTVVADVIATTTFTGDLGTAVVTVEDGATLSAAYALVTAKTINQDAMLDDGVTPALGTGALIVDIALADAAADLSTILGNISTMTANFTEDQTFTGNLDGADATVEALVDLVVSSSIIDGLTVTGANTSTIDLTDLATNLAADLSGITVTGSSATAAFATSGTFTGDLGTVTVTIADGAIMTAAASVLVISDVNKDTVVGTGAVVVTVATADANANLSTLINTASVQAADISSITITETLTFTGALHGVVATQVADGATLSTTAAIADSTTDTAGLISHAIDMAGTTGEVIIDASNAANTDIAGTANFTVTDLEDGIDASMVSGTLDVAVLDANTGGSAVTLGGGVNTIDADALIDTNVLLLTGTDVADTAEQTTVTFAGGVYVIGDVINVTIDGVLYTHTVSNILVTAIATAFNTLINGVDANVTSVPALGVLTLTAITAGREIVVSSATNSALGTAVAAESVSHTLAIGATIATTVNGDIIAAISNNDGDTTTGGATLIGGDGTNIIQGTNNDDTINGGVDADTLTGNDGDDTFIFDSAFDVVLGESIDGGLDLDTVVVNTTSIVDFSLATTFVNMEVLDLSSAATNIVMTGAQQAQFSTVLGSIVATADDSVTYNTLSAQTVTGASPAVDTFEFAAGDTATVISAFGTEDFIDVVGSGAARTIVDGAGATTVLNTNEVIYLDAVAGDLASTTTAGAAITAADGFTETGIHAFFVVTDDTDTYIYEYNQAAFDGAIAANELTLMGTIDAALVSADIIA